MLHRSATILEPMKGYGLNICPWYWRTLRFLDSNLESEFWASQTGQFQRTLDSFCMLIQCCLVIFSFGQIVLSKRVGIVLWMGSVLQAMVHTAITMGSLWGAGWYSKHRTMIVVCSHWVGMSTLGILFSIIHTQKDSAFSLGGGLATSLSICCLTLLPTLARVPFWVHVQSHCVATLLSVRWLTSIFCRAFSRSAKLGLVIEAISANLDAGIAAVGLWWTMERPPGDNSALKCSIQSNSCWMVAAFLYITCVAIVPSAVVYCLESYLRTVYVLSQAQHKTNKAKCWRMWYESVLVAFWWTVILSMGLWAGLRLADDFQEVIEERLRI